MKRGTDVVERYMMIIDIMSSLGMDFESLTDMPDYQIYQLHNELIESRIQNHLGFKR